LDSFTAEVAAFITPYCTVRQLWPRIASLVFRGQKRTLFELDVMVYKLSHHVGMTHWTKHKETSSMGFRLFKIVTLLLVPKDFLR